MQSKAIRITHPSVFGEVKFYGRIGADMLEGAIAPREERSSWLHMLRSGFVPLPIVRHLGVAFLQETHGEPEITDADLKGAYQYWVDLNRSASDGTQLNNL